MALDQDKLPRILRRFGKSLKRVLHSSTPKNVHGLRTGSRRLEAAIQALALEDRPRARRLLKSMAGLRKKAGRVRDLDVFTKFASKLATPGQEDSLVELLEHLGAKRQKAARKLQNSVSRRGRSAKHQLKRCRVLFRPGRESIVEWQLKVTSAASELSAELASWPRLTRGNLHPYRLKMKELRYTLQLDNASNAELIAGLEEVTDAIGEWHDWSEFLTIAAKLFEGKPRSHLLNAIRSTASAKLRYALSLAEAMQKQHMAGAAPISMHRI